MTMNGITLSRRKLMKLMTKEIEKKLPTLGSTDGLSPDQIPVIAKFFTPDANYTWYVTEGEKDRDDYRLFGWVEGPYPELGYFMLSDLEGIRGPLGLKVERDRYFTATLNEVR